MEQLTCLRVTGKGLADVMGQSRPKRTIWATSAFPPIATELRTSLEVRFVPTGDIWFGMKGLANCGGLSRGDRFTGNLSVGDPLLASGWTMAVAVASWQAAYPRAQSSNFL
jgi:hypothetical protein